MKAVPSLFGRVTSVLTDHARLKETIEQLRDACRAESGEGERLTGLIASFSLQLREHFAAEEADGNFGAIVMQRPDLGEAIEARKREHAQLEGILDSLDGALPRIDFADLATVVSSLLHLLQRHEAEENALMRDFVAWKGGG